MDHAEAVRSGAVERYLLGELAEQERDQYEEHVFECPQCADNLKSTVAFVENARAVLAARPHEVSGLHLAVPASDRWRSLVGRVVPLAAAAALVLVVGASAIEIRRLRAELSAAEVPSAAAWSFLSVSRGEPEGITLGRDQRWLGLTLSRSAGDTHPFYRCEVQDAAGQVVVASVVPAPQRGQELQIVLPARRLTPGVHTLVLAGMNAPDGAVAAADIARYQFTLSLQEE